MDRKHPLQDYRERKNWTQSQLADVLGISLQLVSHIETGRRPVTPENAVEWEARLNKELTRYDLRPDLFERRGNDHGPTQRASA